MKTRKQWQSTNCEQIFSSEVLSKRLCVGWCASKSSSFVLLINPVQECNTAFTALRSRGRVKSSSGTFCSIFHNLRGRDDIFTGICLLPDSLQKGHDTMSVNQSSCMNTYKVCSVVAIDNSQNDSTGFYQSADLCWPFRFHITSFYCWPSLVICVRNQLLYTQWADCYCNTAVIPASKIWSAFLHSRIVTKQ